MKQNDTIATLSFEFAIQIVRICNQLIIGKEYVLSKQLLRSGTSIGANVEEASAAQSKRDFIAKMSIASKEARETRYWLKLITVSKITSLDLTLLLEKIEVIIKILTKIVKTAQQNLSQNT